MNESDLSSQERALSDEVLRKIGRNVLLFQQIEGLLKYLVTNHRVDTNYCEGTTSADLVARQQKRAAKVQKQMMGTLVGHYTDSILSDAGEPVLEAEDTTHIRIITTFTIAGDSDFYESRRADMKLMVDERNDLIHHFLPRWQLDSLGHLEMAVAYLDKQREKILPMLDHLQAVTRSVQEAFTVLASDEVQCQFELLWLQGSPLVELLREVSVQKARPDGWAYLSHAGQIARIEESDAVKHLKERYGHSTLKGLLIASELFDVKDEPLSNGGFRTLYRVKNSAG
jgi:hypothetical protein